MGEEFKFRINPPICYKNKFTGSCNSKQGNIIFGIITKINAFLRIIRKNVNV
jgi:hypothetical protein